MRKIILLIVLFCSGISLSQTNKVAILDFENTSGKSEYDALGKLISSVIITELVSLKEEKYTVYDIIKEQNENSFNNLNYLDLAINIGIEKNLDIVIIGKIIVDENKLTIEANCIDIHTKKNIFSISLKDKIENWLILEKDLANKIVEKLK